MKDFYTFLAARLSVLTRKIFSQNALTRLLTSFFSSQVKYLYKRKLAITKGNRTEYRHLMALSALKYALLLLSSARMFVLGHAHGSGSPSLELLTSYLPFYGYLLRRFTFFKFPYAFCSIALQPLFVLYIDHLKNFQIDGRLLDYGYQLVLLNRHRFFALNKQPVIRYFSKKKRIHLFGLAFLPGLKLPDHRQAVRRLWNCSVARFAVPRLRGLPEFEDQVRVRLVLVTYLLDATNLLFSVFCGGNREN